MSVEELKALLRVISRNSALAYLRGRKSLARTPGGTPRVTVDVKRGTQRTVVARSTGRKLKLTAAGRKVLKRHGKLTLRWIAKYGTASAARTIRVVV